MADAIPRGIPIDVPDLTEEHLQAWWRTNQQCEGVCLSIKATLEGALLAGQPMVVHATDGDYTLTDIDKVG